MDSITICNRAPSNGKPPLAVKVNLTEESLDKKVIINVKILANEFEAKTWVLYLLSLQPCHRLHVTGLSIHNCSVDYPDKEGVFGETGSSRDREGKSFGI